MLKKLALLLAFAGVALVYLGWLPKDRAQQFVRMMVGIFVVGFLWRVGVWFLSP